jgi:hypothetical protein
MTAKHRAPQAQDGRPSTVAAADIAADLREILTRGLDLPEETLRFIDSTFSHPSATALAEIIDDDADPERDSLLELLFSPDEPLQIELESRLSRLPGETPSAGDVAARLAAAPLPVRFRFPDGRGMLEVPLTAPLAHLLVHGLGIDRVLPAGVDAAIEATVPGRSGRRLRVMLRNARFEFTPAGCEFLCTLIPKLDIRDEDDRACFAFALELLAELEASAEVYTALSARKKWLARALRHGQQLREQLAQSNFETFLSQGQRLAWVDEPLIRRQISFIDRICVAVFGRLTPVDPSGPSQAVDIEGLPDVADLMQRLT